MHPDATLGFLALLVALLAAAHLPHTVCAFARWISRRLKPLEKHPIVRKCVKGIVLLAGLLILPAHCLFYLLEAWLKLTHAFT